MARQGECPSPTTVALLPQKTSTLPSYVFASHPEERWMRGFKITKRTCQGADG